jgi:DNA-binding winged helix-turn-helix (wHTH) protein
MQGLAPSDIFAFEDFRLDRRGGLFRCNGTGTFEPVAIGSRALDILGALIERAGEVVSKDEIIAAVWPGTVVEDSNLTVQISALRAVLDRGRANGSCIQTIPGRGYRFVARVDPMRDRSASGGRRQWRGPRRRCTAGLAPSGRCPYSMARLAQNRRPICRARRVRISGGLDLGSSLV